MVVLSYSFQLEFWKQQESYEYVLQSKSRFSNIWICFRNQNHLQWTLLFFAVVFSAIVVTKKMQESWCKSEIQNHQRRKKGDGNFSLIIEPRSASAAMVGECTDV